MSNSRALQQSSAQVSNTSMELKDSRNLIKESTGTTATISRGGRVVSTGSSSGGALLAGNNVVVNSGVTRIPATEGSSSTNQSVLGKIDAVIEQGDNYYSSMATAGESNVEDYMYEKLKEDYTDQGSDTSMLYERNSLEEYAIAYQYGDTIFDFCFKTDPYYDTYEELFTQVLSCYSGGIESSSTPTANNTVVQYPVKTSSSTSQRFGWYSYLFAPQVPNDPNRYNENVTLPAIATFKLNTDKEHRTAAMAKHLFLYSNFSRMLYYSNKYTKGPLTRIPHQITHCCKDDEFKLNHDWDGIGCAYGYEFFNGTKGGIIREPSNKWKNLDKRSNVLKAWACTISCRY